jgi:hypothetical protein
MKNFYLLICLIFSFNIHAQSNTLPNGNSVAFKGIIQDSLSNEVIPNANIRFYYNEQLVKNAVSNDKGEFKVMLPKGNYSYTVSCVGFNKRKGTTDSTIQNNKGFEIKLSEATNTTSEVVIKTKKNNIGSIYCRLTRSTSGCSFTYKPYQWLVINPSNYMRGPFLVPPKEKK